MKFEIKNRWNGSVLFSMECDSFRVCVEAAVKSGVNLSGSNLSYSNLSGSNLSYSNLSYSNLSGSDLSYSNLSYSNLRGSDLSGSDLSDSDLSGSDLRGSDLSGSQGADLAIKQRTRILPEGSLIGWKKCLGEVIVKLRIPEEAKRSHAFGRKCRAEFVDVLEVFGDKAISQHDGKTEYVIGQRVHCDKWEEDWTQECAGGIHFYITREEAEAH